MTEAAPDPRAAAAGPPRRRRWRLWARSAPPTGLRRGLVLILLPSMLLVALEIYQAASLVPALQESQAAIAHSFEIIAAAHALDRSTQDAERSERGFLLTGDDSYLEPYDAAIERIPEKLNRLYLLVSDNPAQQNRLSVIADELKIKLAELKDAIAVRRMQGFEAAREAVKTQAGGIAMSTISDHVSALIEGESRLLGRRQAAFFNLVRVSAATSTLAAWLALAVIITGGLVLWRGYRRLIRSQMSLQRSEERFRLLVSGVRDYALFMLDVAGNIVSWNDGAERLCGYRNDDILGKPFSTLIASDDASATAAAALLEGARTAGSAEDERWWTRKDGSRFWANAVITALRSPDGSLRGFAEVVRDATAWRRQQEALDQSRAALAQLQKMEAIGQLTGGVAHDFNNLLQSILGSVELLQRPDGLADRARTERLLDTARRAAERGATLTQRLLAFARRQPLAPQIVDVNKLVASMSDLLHRTLGETIEVETVAAAGLWRAYIDPNQLENAILNLAVNARDAMPEGGRLTIETGNTWLDDAYAAADPEVSPGQYIMIAISDSGEGMSEEALAHAFEPFFTTKPEGRGTGLGLAQVHGFVKQSGGHIKLYSERGQGTTVKIYLPRHLHSEPGSARVDDAEPRGQPVRARVLIVEDDEDVRSYGADALETLGYTVFQAAESRTALRILDEHPDIELLFTDIGLPDLNGRKLAEEARRRAPEIKVLFTTGYARNAIVHNGVLDSGVDLLGKPFTTEALGRKIAQVLTR